MTIGDKIKAARRAQKGDLSQEDVDSLSGVGAGRTWSYESGRSKPKPGYIKKLAELWAIPEAWFYSDDDEPPYKTLGDARGARVAGFVPSEPGTPRPLRDEWAPTALAGRYAAVEWLRASEDIGDCLMRGDLLLAVHGAAISSGALHAVTEGDGRTWLATVRKSPDGALARALGSADMAPIPEGADVSLVVELRRIMPGGLTVVYEAETGLSEPMLPRPQH